MKGSPGSTGNKVARFRVFTVPRIMHGFSHRSPWSPVTLGSDNQWCPFSPLKLWLSMVLEWSMLSQSWSTLCITRAVAAGALKHRSHHTATESNHFNRCALEQCQELMTWVKTPMTILFNSWTNGKKGLVISGGSKAGAWVMVFNCLKCFSWSASQQRGSLYSPFPFMASYKGFAIIEKFGIQTWENTTATKKVSYLMVGDWDWEGIDTLFSFNIQSALHSCQVWSSNIWHHVGKFVPSWTPYILSSKVYEGDL